jgi:hypothetical protein
MGLNSGDKQAFVGEKAELGIISSNVDRYDSVLGSRKTAFADAHRLREFPNPHYGNHLIADRAARI